MASETWVLIGNGSLLAACGDLLLEHGQAIAAVVTSEPANERWATEKGIRVEPSDVDLVGLLRHVKFDHLASIAHLSIIPTEVLRLVPGLAINFHDGPLPELAGLNVTSWAILRGEKAHGVTWHAMTDRLDAGRILEERRFDVSPDETAFLLNVKCYAAGLDSFADLVGRMAADDTSGRDQDLTARSYFGRWTRPAGAGVIDWQARGEDISALVRALDFGSHWNPLCSPKIFLGDRFVSVRRARVTSRTSDLPAGTIQAAARDQLQIATSSVDVVLDGLADLDGTPLSLGDLIPGRILPQVSPELRTRLITVQSLAIRFEDAWRATLASLTFPDLDIGAGPASSTTSAVALERVPEGNRIDTVIAGIVVLAARRSGAWTLDIAYSDTDLAGRAEGTFGAFVSQLPLRVTIDRNAHFKASVAAVAAAREKLHRSGVVAADLWARDPHLRASGNGRRLGDATISIGVGVEPPPARIRFAVSADATRCELISHAPDLPAQLGAVFTNVLGSPGRPVCEIDLMSDADLNTVLRAWNDTARPVSDLCIHDQFVEQARRAPDATALVFNGRRMSYRELHERTTRLARHLRTLGVGPEVRVGIFLRRSFAMVEAVLATLKAGGAYVPLDPSYPADRIGFMVQDSELQLIVSDDSLRSRLPSGIFRVVNLDAEKHAIEQLSAESLDAGANPADLAYVIYTSGSTGRPKGVMIEHRNVANFAVGMDGTIDRSGDQKTWLAVTSLSFDISVLELLWTLARGFTVVLHRDDERESFMTAASSPRVRGPAEPETIPSLMISHGVTHFQCTPTMAEILLHDPAARPALHQLRQMLVGGEALPEHLARDLASTVGGVLTNVYGPTETTIWSSSAQVARSGSDVTIGFPIANTTLHVLDRDGRVASVGVAGELHIGGKGVVRGYWKRPELTAERFVADPFDGGRLYRTGDLVRRRRDGALEFLGRLDHQVKVRGHRIELGEIEARLSEHPAVTTAVVVARDDGAGQDLVAYLIARSGSIDEADLRTHLRARVPDYMMPRTFVRLTALPMTPNRKIDRKALPAPQRASVAVSPEARPAGGLEQKLAALWSDLLGVDGVGLQDSFFDLGGNSLMAVRLFARMRKMWGVDLPLATLFAAPTLEALAAEVRTHLGSTLDTAPTPGAPAVAAPVKRAWSPLVMIRKGGARPPFFCVHGAGGNLLNFRDFSERLSSEQPVYGLQAPGVDGELPPAESIEEMADLYLDAICRQQPHGPYMVGGYSGGGVVALEIARRLARIGERPREVVLLDTLHPSTVERSYTWRDQLRHLVTGGYPALKLFVTANVERRFVWARRTRRLHRYLSRGKAVPHELREWHLTTSFLGAVRKHDPAPYEGHVTLFRAQEIASVYEHTGRRLGWNETTLPNLEVIEVPGGHDSLVREPNVRLLAAGLESVLRRGSEVPKRKVAVGV